MEIAAREFPNDWVKTHQQMISLLYGKFGKVA
jgi:hypothetical protein